MKTISTQTNITRSELAADGLGNAFALWALHDSAISSGAAESVQYAALDGSAPELRSFSVPAAGTAGDQQTVTAGAFDVWSPVSVAWDFGDGSTGAGDTAGHAFAATGTFSVEATATDAVGYSAAAAKAITVGAKPPPATPPTPVAPVAPVVTPTKPKPGLRATWRVVKRYTIAASVSITNIPKNATITLSCEGKGLPIHHQEAEEVHEGHHDGKCDQVLQEARTRRQAGGRGEGADQDRCTQHADLDHHGEDPRQQETVGHGSLTPHYSAGSSTSTRGRAQLGTRHARSAGRPAPTTAVGAVTAPTTGTSHTPPFEGALNAIDRSSVPR